MLTTQVQVFNLQRLAVLTTALGRSPPDPELIYEAMKDRIHQPYRMALVRSRPSPLPALSIFREMRLKSLRRSLVSLKSSRP